MTGQTQVDLSHTLSGRRVADQAPDQAQDRNGIAPLEWFESDPDDPEGDGRGRRAGQARGRPARTAPPEGLSQALHRHPVGRVPIRLWGDDPGRASHWATERDTVVWLDGWIRARNKGHHLKKLSNARRPESHLFVLLPGFFSAPFAATDLLMRNDASDISAAPLRLLDQRNLPPSRVGRRCARAALL
jgi:hypothetical protein